MVLYYGIITVAAVTIGAVLTLLVKPGVGVQSFISQASAYTAQAQVREAFIEQQNNISQIFLNMIPQNPVASIAMGDMIPVLVFALIFAIALAQVGEVARPIVGFLNLFLLQL